MGEIETKQKRQRRRSLLLLSGLAVGMFGFGFALVPLYGLLCQVTGIQSVEQRTAVRSADISGESSVGPVEAIDEERWITVKFDATVHPALPWALAPMERKVRVHPGETRQVMFIAENRSGSEITGQAIPSIAPWQATDFFNKLECFCFTQQTLAGGEVKEMPLQFTVSKDLPEDIASLTLSYNVMRVSEPEPVAAR